MVQRERAPMMDIVVKGLTHIFGELKPFLVLPFLDIFFRGFPIDCSSDEFEARAVCSAFYTGEVKSAIQLNKTHFGFSFMGNVSTKIIDDLRCLMIKLIYYTQGQSFGCGSF